MQKIQFTLTSDDHVPPGAQIVGSVTIHGKTQPIYEIEYDSDTYVSGETMYGGLVKLPNGEIWQLGGMSPGISRRAGEDMCRRYREITED